MTNRTIKYILFFIFISLSAGPVFAQDILPIGDPVPQALGFHMSNYAFGFVETAGEQILENFDIEAMIMAENPIMDDEVDCPIPLLSDGDILINVTNLDYDPIQIGLAVTPFPTQPHVPGAIYAQVLVTNLRVDLDVEIDDLCEISTDLEPVATADSVITNIAIDIDFYQTEEGTFFSIVLDNIQTPYMTGFDLDADLPSILEWIVDLFEDTIEKEINDLMEEMVMDLIAPIIEQLPKDIPLFGEVPIEALGTSLTYDIYVGQYAPDVNGLKIVLGGEIVLEGISDCVDLGDPPGSRWTFNNFPDLLGLTPEQNPYHMAMLLGDDIINKLFYTAYASGLLCQTFDESIFGGFVSSNALERAIPGMGRVLDEDSALDDDDDTGDDDTGDDDDDEPEEGDILFVLQPHAPPLFDVSDGQPDLMKISIDELDLNIYEFVSERWIRSLSMTLSLSVGAGFDMANNLFTITVSDPVIDHEITYNEYGSFDDDSIQLLIDTAIAVAWPMLLDLLGDGFEVPSLVLPTGDVIGLQLDYKGPVGEGLDYLGAYMSLTIETPEDAPDTRVVLYSNINGKSLSVDYQSLDLRQSAEYGLNDSYDLFVDFDAVLPPGVFGVPEYSYRLDGGFWSHFSPSTQLKLPLILEGKHLLEVRSRLDGRTDPTPAQVTFHCDGVAPRFVELAIEDDLQANVSSKINVRGYDWQTPAGQIRYSLMVDGGSWSQAVTAGELTLPGLNRGQHVIRIRAIDIAGNISEESELSVEANLSGSSSGGACGY